MKLKSFVFVAIAALVAAAPAWAGEEILFAPPAEWVAAREPAPETIAEPDLPVAVLSFDTQVRNEGQRQDIYSASMLKFLTSQGLGAGNLAFAWRPETDDLTVHKVLIHREGETIDVLGEGQTFTVLRREQNLEQAMLDGTLTANLFPDGLQVGDVLEVATTITTRNPVTGDHAEALVGPLNLAAGRADVTLSWPARTDMRLARTDDLPQWKRTRRGGYEFAELSLTDLRPIVPPRGAPSRFALVRMAQASDYASWGEVSQLFAPLYVEAATIPADGALRNEVEKIRAASEDPVVRAEKALTLVQERVRYVALLSGLGGLVPASAADTWTRRYGDCKGKTALLMGILAELGIDSEPVLVSTVIGEALDERLPGVGLFDHVILHATIEGREYWLDGTRTGDSSLARLEVPYFGWGLPVRAAAAELVRLMPEPPAQPLEDLAIEFDAREGLYGDVPARLEIVYRGDAAIGLNAALSQMAGDVRDRALREFWRGRLNFVEADQVRSAFDPATGEMRLTLEGTAKMDWDDGWYATDYTRVGYRADFSRDAGPLADVPFELGYPTFERSKQTILLPTAFTTEAIYGDVEVDEVVGGIRYFRHASLEGGRFVIERSEQAMVPELSASEARAAERRLRELWDKRVHLRLAPAYLPTAADLGAADDLNVDAMVSLGNRLLDTGKHREAIELLGKAIEREPGNEWAWANIAIANAHLNKVAEAQTAIARVEGINPDNHLLWNARGLLAANGGDLAGAVTAYSRAIELEPSNHWARGQRAAANIGLKNYTSALEDAQRLRFGSDEVNPFSLLEAVALGGLGRAAESRDVFDRLLARFGDIRVLQGMANSTFKAGLPEDFLDGILEQGASPMALTMRAQRREIGDYKLKFDDLNQALQIDPQFIPALIERANLYWSEYEFRRALADVDRAIEIDPRTAEAYKVKAKILIDQGRTGEIAKVAQAIIALAPDDPTMLVEAAQVYSMGNLKTKAKETIARAYQLKPDDPYVNAVHGWLMDE
jgi:tetratricopeptide (TPR) repeat protein